MWVAEKIYFPILSFSPVSSISHPNHLSGNSKANTSEGKILTFYKLFRTKFQIFVSPFPAEMKSDFNEGHLVQ